MSVSACDVTIHDGGAEAKYPLATLLDLLDRRLISRQTFEELIGTHQEMAEIHDVQKDLVEDVWDVI